MPPHTLSKILETRRDFASSQLREVCLEHESPRILSVGNGLLREAEPILDLCQAAGGTFVVLCEPGETPGLCGTDNSCVRCVSYPYGAIPSEENIGQFDFVYALNLLNELDARRAKQVVARMLSLVRPGGRLLLSNFTAELASRSLAGYYRREEEMAALLPYSEERQLLGHAIWRDDSRTVLYMEIQTAGLVCRGSTPGLSFLH